MLECVPDAYMEELLWSLYTGVEFLEYINNFMR